MTHEQQPDRSRPGLPKACRDFLREALADPASVDVTRRAHAGECVFCAARLAARSALAKALSRRPSPPSELATELASKALLESVYSRVVEQAESGPLANLLACKPQPPASEEEMGWPESLLQTDLGRQAIVPPARPVPDAVWSGVRTSILVALVAHTARSARRHWAIGIAGAAAAAILFSLLVSEGTHPPPEIVFKDLDTMPAVDFAILRHGAIR